MTRDEQIKKEFLRLRDEENICPEFEDGAQWADENPPWRKYPDEKPTEKGSYLICTKDGFVDLNVYTIGKDSQNQEEWVLCNKDDVIAWMPLPQPPKFLKQDKPTN